MRASVSEIAIYDHRVSVKLCVCMRVTYQIKCGTYNLVPNGNRVNSIAAAIHRHLVGCVFVCVLNVSLKFFF